MKPALMLLIGGSWWYNSLMQEGQATSTLNMLILDLSLDLRRQK